MLKTCEMHMYDFDCDVLVVHDGVECPMCQLVNEVNALSVRVSELTEQIEQIQRTEGEERVMDDCQHVWSDDDCCQHCIRCGIGRDVADSESKIAELTAEVERLQTCVHDLKIANSYAVQRIDNLSVDVQTANSRLAEERAENERLRAALAWYADHANWRARTVEDMPNAWIDYGDRARAALGVEGE